MILTADIGNTRTKLVAWSQEGNIEEVRLASLEDCQDLFQKADIIGWSSTNGQTNPSFPGFTGKVFELKHSVKLPFVNRYKTPATLGKDRIAAVAGAMKLHPQKQILIIDAGTCITTDNVTAEGEYLGGSISPGLKMRYRALSKFTGSLPLLDFQLAAEYIGRSTADSIHSGVWMGMLAEINDRITNANAGHADTVVILTGGDATLLADHLKYRIFAEPLLVHYGILYCLKINEF